MAILGIEFDGRSPVILRRRDARGFVVGPVDYARRVADSATLNPSSALRD